MMHKRYDAQNVRCTKGMMHKMYDAQKL